MKVQESAQNYLETILILQRRNGTVRAVDIANELAYSKASVSVAMRHLREDELISVDRGGYIALLPKGQTIAEKMLERHEMISRWLIHLGVPEDIAIADACRMEHVISEESFEAMKNHVMNRE